MITVLRQKVTKQLRPQVTNVPNKQLCLSLARLSSLVLCLFIRPGAYPSMEHLKNASLGKASALLASIRLGCKGLQGSSTLIY